MNKRCWWHHWTKWVRIGIPTTSGQKEVKVCQRCGTLRYRWHHWTGDDILKGFKLK